MMAASLAVLDWGIGGLDFCRIFKEQYPEVGICYISDAGAVPYGKQQKAQLSERLGRVLAFMTEQGVSQLVVACNAMSTVLPDMTLRGSMQDFKLTGVIEPAISAALALMGETAGVVGGRRTILSGAYGKPLRQHFRSVTQRIAQPLSALIERGEKDTPLFHDTLEKIMAPLRKTDILVLACTHYPAALEAFQALAPGAQLLNPAAETLKWVMQHWHFDTEYSSDMYFTTGDPDDMRSASLSAFGVSIGEIKRILL